MHSYAGQLFATAQKEDGKSGMLYAVLEEQQTKQQLIVLNTHLKAKAGDDNEQIRVHQVSVPVAQCALAWLWVLLLRVLHSCCSATPVYPSQLWAYTETCQYTY